MEGGKTAGDHIEPRDAYNIAYLIHFLLGAGNLLPWNALITAVDYFGYLYPSQHIGKVFSVAYMTSSLPVLALMMSAGRWCRTPSFRFRTNLGFSMFVLSLLTPPVLAWTSCGTYSPHSRPDGAYGVIVIAVVICGLADGLVAGSLIGSAGVLPKRYMQAVFAGTASSGVLVSVLRIMTKASLPQTPRGLQTSAHLYFVLSTLIMLGCIVCCNILQSLTVMQHYQHKTSQCSTATTPMHYLEPQPVGRATIWGVAKKIRCPAFGIFIIYVVTLSIFPGYITENVKSNPLGDWYPIFLVTMYNVMDLVGKCLTAIYVPNNTRKALWGCIARLFFYPLFTGCLHGPRWLRTEIPVVLLTALLGLTNGYLTSILMILAPKFVPVSEAETAGIVMLLFLGIGLVGGSVLGWLWIV